MKIKILVLLAVIFSSGFFTIFPQTSLAAECKVMGVTRIFDSAGKQITSSSILDKDGKPVFIKLSAKFTFDKKTCPIDKAKLETAFKKYYTDGNGWDFHFKNVASSSGSTIPISIGRVYAQFLSETAQSLSLEFIEPSYEVGTLDSPGGGKVKVGDTTPIWSRLILSGFGFVEFDGKRDVWPEPLESSKVNLKILAQSNAPKDNLPVNPTPPSDSGTPKDPGGQANNPPPTTRDPNQGRIGLPKAGCEGLADQFAKIGGQAPEALTEQCVTPGGAVGRLTKIGFGLAGSLAVVFVVIGGVRYLVSAGKQGETTAAKNTITWAVLGLVAVVLAYLIVTLVTQLVTS